MKPLDFYAFDSYYTAYCLQPPAPEEEEEVSTPLHPSALAYRKIERFNKSRMLDWKARVLRQHRVANSGS